MNVSVLDLETLEQAAQQLDRLMDNLGPRQRKMYRNRIVRGQISWAYVAHNNDGKLCGCIFGTYALLKSRTLRDEPDRVSGSLIDKIFGKIGFKQSFDRIPLESIGFSISMGDTPKTNHNSEWLFQQVERYMREHGEL